MPATTSGGAPDRSRPWAASTGWAARLLMPGYPAHLRSLDPGRRRREATSPAFLH